MELPDRLKILYRHWPRHVAVAAKPRAAAVPSDLQFFINQRLSIWQKKTSGSPPPFTADPILSKFRFCNVLRELDRQTIEYHTLLNPLRDDFPLWLLNMFYCRLVARPATVRHAGLLSFNLKDNDQVYDRLLNASRPRFGTPYVFPVSVILRSPTPTRELFLTKFLPSIMKKIAAEIQTWKNRSVYDGVQTILPLFGYKLHFLWTEVLIDVAYQFPDHLDLFARFPIGPGALPTLERLEPDKDPSVLVAELAALGLTLDLAYNGSPLRLSAENWEGVACECRKYANLKAGRGRKRKYAPPTL